MTAPSWYENLFDDAPCFRPYNLGNGHYQDFNWSSGSIVIHPEERGDATGDNIGYYYGLDYLFLYSLNSILRNKEYQNNFYDYSERYNIPYQYNAVAVGNSSHPLNVYAVNDVFDNKIVYHDGVVHYRAGHHGYLQAGFDARPGSEFSLTVEPYECNTGSNFDRIIQASPVVEVKGKNNFTGNSLYVNLFPMPFSDKISLQLANLKPGSLEINIFDIYGRELIKTLMVVTHENTELTKLMEMNSLASGNYIIKIKNENNSVSKLILKTN